VAVLALAFDLLFFAVDQLPATVPAAVALALVQMREMPRATRWSPTTRKKRCT
jgi:hypothetical protein